MAEERRVVVLVDLTAPRQDAAKRAAVVAIELGATLCLLHVLPPARASGGGDAALAAAATKLSVLAERLTVDYGATVETRAVRSETVRGVLEECRTAQLLVLPSRGRNTLREILFGNSVERLIRLVNVPVLVVKGPALQPSYSCVLVPVRLSVQAIEAAKQAALLAPSADIHVLHVISTTHDVVAQIAQVPEKVMQSSRDKAAEVTRNTIAHLLGRAGFCRPAQPMAGFGDHMTVTLHKAASLGADLVAVGKYHRKVLARFLLGRFTQQLLAQADADILVVPLPSAAPQSPLRRVAAERLAFDAERVASPTTDG